MDSIRYGRGWYASILLAILCSITSVQASYSISSWYALLTLVEKSVYKAEIDSLAPILKDQRECLDRIFWQLNNNNYDEKKNFLVKQYFSLVNDQLTDLLASAVILTRENIVSLRVLFYEFKNLLTNYYAIFDTKKSNKLILELIACLDGLLEHILCEKYFSLTVGHLLYTMKKNFTKILVGTILTILAAYGAKRYYTESILNKKREKIRKLQYSDILNSLNVLQQSRQIPQAITKENVEQLKRILKSCNKFTDACCTQHLDCLEHKENIADIAGYIQSLIQQEVILIKEKILAFYYSNKCKKIYEKSQNSVGLYSDLEKKCKDLEGKLKLFYTRNSTQFSNTLNKKICQFIDTITKNHERYYILLQSSLHSRTEWKNYYNSIKQIRKTLQIDQNKTLLCEQRWDDLQKAYQQLPKEIIQSTDQELQEFYTGNNKENKIDECLVCFQNYDEQESIPVHIFTCCNFYHCCSSCFSRLKGCPQIQKETHRLTSIVTLPKQRKEMAAALNFWRKFHVEK